MTVISKSMGEKKPDTLEEPLVENIVTEHPEGKKVDVEAGQYVPPQGTHKYIITSRARPYYTLIFILMLVLLFTTCLLGIFGTEYLYQQYRYLVGVEKPDVYRAWGTITYDEPAAMVYKKADDMLDQQDSPNIAELFSKLDAQRLNDKEQQEAIIKQQKNEMKEEFELDLDQEQYEKISVPSGGNSRFIHDFYSNLTAIVDTDNSRCFIMPLNRTTILPPKSLYDLLLKMADGYYSVDTEKVREDMRVVLPAVDDIDSLGTYVSAECRGFATYKLEKFVGGIVKRSLDLAESGMFRMFAGVNLMEFHIQGIPNARDKK